MGTRTLKVWAPDGLALQRLNLATLKIEEIPSPGWDWKRFHTDLLRSLANGSAPDVIEIGSTWTTRLAQEGVLLNITKFATEQNAASTFFPRTLYSCRDAVQIDQYYALPLLADVRILFYNVDFLNAYLTSPNHQNPFKSWNAFKEMCETLKEKWPNSMIAWPLGIDAFHDSLPWIWAAGGDIISPSHQVLIDSERTQEAIFRLASLILTGCAPVPPHHNLIDTLEGLRNQFTAGNIGIIAGALWVTHIHGWQSRFKAALYPPDIFPATLIGGSNIGIVRKHGDDENAEEYQLAKKFLKLMVNVDNQINFAKAIGKLPGNLSAWKQMKQQEQDENLRAVLEVFDEALCYTVDHGMPNLLNFEQIEEELKTCIRTIWEEVGNIQGASLEEKEKKCKEMIRQKLTETRQQIEKFLTGYTVQYTKQEVEKIGITPPGTFDLWIEVTSNTPKPRRIVYVKGRGKIQKGIGPKRFRILLALVNAPERTLSQEKLLGDFFEYSPSSDHKRMDEIFSLEKELSALAKLLKESLQLTPSQLSDKLQQNSAVPPYSTLVNELRGISIGNLRIRFQESAYALITRLCEEIQYITDNSKRGKKVDDLRKAYEGLNKEIGQIGGKTVINRLSPDNYDLYLDRDLSICVVVP